MNEALIKILIKTYEDLLEHYQEIRNLSKKHDFAHQNPRKIERYVKKKQKLLDRICAKHRLADTLWKKGSVDAGKSDYDKVGELKSEAVQKTMYGIFSDISDVILQITELEDRKVDVINSIKDGLAEELGVIKNKNLISRYNLPKNILPGSFIDKKKPVD